MSTPLFLITTIAAYAQPQGEQQRACPEGFTLSKGECQMEPEITTILVCPDNLPESPQGNCITGTGSPISAVCPKEYPYEFPSLFEVDIEL
jgi:hypothetical protein